jgi:hypothetical protein
MHFSFCGVSLYPGLWMNHLRPNKSIDAGAARYQHARATVRRVLIMEPNVQPSSILPLRASCVDHAEGEQDKQRRPSINPTPETAGKSAIRKRR